MTNMFKMMKDAVLAQRNLKKIQDDLKRKTVEYTGANGKVRVTAGGDASILSIKIDPSLIIPDRAAEMETKVAQAVNGALDEAKKMSAEYMRGMMADMGLPNIPGL
jgi:nucleoid-associated protein EbfC